MSDETNNKRNGETPTEVTFYYKKSEFFRTVHSDGVTGSVTPKGNIFLSFYNERFPLPDSVTYEVDADGDIAEMPSKKSYTSNGFMREVEMGVVMSLTEAENLRDLLSQILNDVNKNQIIEQEVEREL